MPVDLRLLKLLVFGSGAAALAMETLWMRRLALVGGSTGLATTATLAVYMGTLGLGAWLAPRWLRGNVRTYGALEWGTAAWVIVGTPIAAAVAPLVPGPPVVRVSLLATLLLALPGLMHGATLPVLARACRDRADVTALYAWNTAGAVAGTLFWTFVVLPTTTVRIAEWTTALLALCIGSAARTMPDQPQTTLRLRDSDSHPWQPLVIAGVSGFVALAVEVCGARVTALLVGGSVYAFALVLAVFLTGIALGSHLTRHRAPHPAGPLTFLALSVLIFCGAWRVLPHGVALIWSLGGETLWLPGTALMLLCTLGPVAVASGATFAACMQQVPGETGRAAGRLLASNTLGSVLGATVAGLVALPALGLWGTAVGAAILACLVAIVTGPTSRWRMLAGLPLVFVGLVPRWDPALYAVGSGLRVAEFADLSPDAIERFAHQGWELLDYTDGVTTTVAVGRSTTTGNIWLSLNGKVDASTGRDMATQELSGILPVEVARPHHPAPQAVVIGLASGVTASRTLTTGAEHVTVLEIEPAVVSAARAFSQANHDLLDDPRVDVQVVDARAWLASQPHQYPVIISEPSNPWLTGVSNLFTQEYWLLTRARLTDNGVFCQWIQLYALPPEAFQGLVRTFLSVYPNAWLFESIPGADALLIAAPSLPDDLSLKPTLGPDGLMRLASMGPLVTDNHPWVEFSAPFWLHRATGATNQGLIEAAKHP